MSSRQLSNVQDRHGVLNIGANSSPTDDVRLPYTQLPPDSHPNLPKYPPRHPGRGVPQVPSITLLAHGIHLNHDPEQARLSIPPDTSKSQKQVLSKPKSDPADGRASKVPECFINDDDDRDRSSLFHAATEAI